MEAVFEFLAELIGELVLELLTYIGATRFGKRVRRLSPGQRAAYIAVAIAALLGLVALTVLLFWQGRELGGVIFIAVDIVALFLFVGSLRKEV